MKVHGWEMRAVGGPLERHEREEAAPAAGQALVRVVGCGVCHTDLGFLYDGVPTRHPLPLVLGHEIAGVVEAAGKGAEALVGQRVIVPAVLPCGACALCRKGRGDICKAQIFPGNDAHGGFASHVLVPAAGLCPVPAGVGDDRELARLSVVADAVSTAYSAVQKSGLRPGDVALFIGIGGVGGFGVQIAHALGARVFALDVSPERLDLMARHGADWTLNVKEFPGKALRARLREIAAAEKLPAMEWKIFETSGTPAGQETAFGLLNHGAYLGVVGYHPGEVTVRLSNLMAFAARAEGTWGCPPELYPEILGLAVEGRIQIEPFVEYFPMSRVNEVLAGLREHRIGRRPILLPDFAG